MDEAQVVNGKEALRKGCLAEVEKILGTNSDAGHQLVVKDLCFASFVVR